MTDQQDEVTWRDLSLDDDFGVRFRDGSMLSNSASVWETIRQARADCAALERELEDARQVIGLRTNEVDRYRVHVAAVEGDITRIRDAIQEEAESRDWCSEYNDFCERLNRSLSQPWMHFTTEEQTQRYTVDVTVIARRDQFEAVWTRVREELDGFDVSDEVTAESVEITVRT